MEVFENYTQESILKDAMEELKAKIDDTQDDSIPLSGYESLSILESIDDLDEFLGSPLDSTSSRVIQPEYTGNELALDDVFYDSVFGDSCPSPECKLVDDVNVNQSMSTDCIDQSFVFSDTTEVITSSDILGELMSKSGITSEEISQHAQNGYSLRKRKAPSSTEPVAGKLMRYSEVGVDECNSIYSSSASSPDDKNVVRRQKNNEASKISRANRKAKQQKLFEKEKELEKDNARLHKLIAEMTAETEMLRNILVQKLSGT